MNLYEFLVGVLVIVCIYAIALWTINSEAKIDNMTYTGEEWPEFDYSDHKYPKP